MTVVLAIIALVAIAIGLALSLHLVFFYRNTVPYVLTPRRVLEEITSQLALNYRDKVIDLGCGDGRVLAACYQANRSCSLLGVDNNPVAVFLAKLRLLGHAQIVWSDMNRIKFGEYTKVFCYLSDAEMARLEPIFARELKPYTKVVSLQFAMPTRKARATIDLKSGPAHANRLYVYDY